MLNTSTHRLTDIPGVLHPQTCQKCGLHDPLHQIKIRGEQLARWQEHDHNDQPENKILVLCNLCAKRMIEAHPRLYRQLAPFEPWPGAMGICLDCANRDGITCTQSKASGGAGVLIKVQPPATAMVDGTRNGKRTGWRQQIWFAPPSGCNKKQQQQQQP